MAVKITAKVPRWLQLLRTFVDYATKHEHDFDITISTAIGKRTLSLNFKGKIVKRPVE